MGKTIWVDTNDRHWQAACRNVFSAALIVLDCFEHLADEILVEILSIRDAVPVPVHVHVVSHWECMQLPSYLAVIGAQDGRTVSSSNAISVSFCQTDSTYKSTCPSQIPQARKMLVQTSQSIVQKLRLHQQQNKLTVTNKELQLLWHHRIPLFITHLRQWWLREYVERQRLRTLSKAWRLLRAILHLSTRNIVFSTKTFQL